VKKKREELLTVTRLDGRAGYSYTCLCGVPFVRAIAKERDASATTRRGLWCPACHTFRPYRDHSEQRG
jgi:hypothetical protein